MKVFGGICSRSFTPANPETKEKLRLHYAPWELTPAGEALLFSDAVRKPALATEDGVTICGELTDPRSALAAYRRCGPDFVHALRGEFAFVVIDPLHRRIVLGTDRMGLSPMYFAQIGDDLAWGSAASLVARHPGYRFSPDPVAIAEFLFTIPGNRGRSFYSEIARVQGGSLRVATSDAITESVYWRPGQASTLRLKKEEAAEGLRERLAAAIRLHHQPEKTAVLMSGGLDSVSIVCLTASLGLDVRPYALVFPGDAAADESTLIDVVARRWGLQTDVLGIGERRGAPPAPGTPDLPDLGTTPNLQMHAPQFASMREDGMAVCLHGIGGDQLFAPDRFSLRRNVISALAPRYARYLWRRLSGQSPLRFVDPSFASRHHLWQSLEAAHLPTLRTAARRSAVQAITDASLIRVVEQLSLLAASEEVDLRSPLLDDGVVDFVLSLDPRVAFSEPPKSLLREAMKGVVPEEIRTRIQKAEFSRWFDDDLRIQYASENRGLLEAPGPAAEMISGAARTAALRYLDSGDDLDGRWLFDHTVTVQRWFVRATEKVSAPAIFQYQLGSFSLVSDLELPLPSQTSAPNRGTIVVRRGASARTDVKRRMILYDGETRLVRETLMEDLLPRFLSACGELVIHGSAVMIGSEAVVLVGPSGAGKSTLAHALAVAGHVAIADDFVPFVQPGRIAVASLERRVRPDSAAVLRIPSIATTSRGKIVVSGSTPVTTEVVVGQILFLERVTAPEATLQPIGRDEVFSRLVESRYVLDPLDDDLLERHMDLAVAVAECVPAVRLLLPHRYEAIPGTIKLLENLRTLQCA